MCKHEEHVFERECRVSSLSCRHLYSYQRYHSPKKQTPEVIKYLRTSRCLSSRTTRSASVRTLCTAERLRRSKGSQVSRLGSAISLVAGATRALKPAAGYDSTPHHSVRMDLTFDRVAVTADRPFWRGAVHRDRQPDHQCKAARPPPFLIDASTVPGGGPCASSPCTGATNKGGALSVVTEASLDSLYGLHSLSFVNSKGSAQFTTRQACLLSLTAWRRLRTMCSPSVHFAVPAL